MPAEKEIQEPTVPKRTPQSLIKEAHVKEALAACCGKDAVMQSYTVREFTNKGDNYACIVSSVIVAYMKNEKKHWTSFVVKLNPCREVDLMPEMTTKVFEKEGRFYEEIIPKLNAVLRSVGQSELKVPKCYFMHLELENEAIYLGDLRDEGFKMADRMKGLDVPHLLLVLTELGKLHASSIMFKGNKTKDDLLLEYKCLEEMFMNDKATESPQMKQFVDSILQGTANMVSAAEGYEKIAESILALDTNFAKEQLLSSPPFEVICHGDCWTNNFLFKYDDHGSPVDVILLDLQVTRVASPALDLTYLLYTSVIGPIRQNNLQVLLSCYHSSFASVLACGGEKVSFNVMDLEKEYDKRSLFGLMMSLFLIPMMVATQEEVLDFNSVTEENKDSFFKQQKEKGRKAMKNNPLLRPRLLDMLDDMVIRGVFEIIENN